MPVKHIITNQRVHPEIHRRAIELRRNKTPAEQKLWHRLRAGRLEEFHFRCQQVIGNYIVDFYCHKAGLVIELDGSQHLDNTEYDQARDQFLVGMGLKVLRFFNSEVENHLNEVLEHILKTCQENTAS
jgi:very-short-patch-repair endonuclease